MTSLSERKTTVALIQEAVANGARLPRACEVACIALRTYRRWLRGGVVHEDSRPTAPRPAPANKLSQEERNRVVAICNQPRYMNKPPSQIVPDLLDEGVYLASEATMYRLLHEVGQVHARGRAQKRSSVPKPTTYCATGPNQVACWDITYLPSRVRGVFYYLYLIEDLFSRKIVGAEVHEEESGGHASDLLERTLIAEQCTFCEVVLHADNGAPMKSQTLRSKMLELGVTPSYSRPRVSDDNPFPESLFRTLKYCPQWPSQGFASLEEARQWVGRFVRWYNDEHRHSQLNFVTPSERHQGKDAAILAKRAAVLEAAKAANPLRWGSRPIRDCKPVGPVMLNPDRSEPPVEVEKAA